MNGGFLLGQQTATDVTEPAAQAARTLAGIGEFVQSVNGRIVLGVLLGTLGLWLLMPGPRRSKGAVGVLGALSAAAGAICVLSLAPLMRSTFQLSFWLMSGLTLMAAVCAVTARSPVYAAVWFALSLLGTGGLFLMNGAQFLGIATVAVYAGAIVVTFLFVLMLAQPGGHAYYDRVGWGQVSQVIGCLAGMLVAAAVIWAVMEPGAIAELAAAGGDRAVDNPQHVATLGGQLFTRHLVAVEAAGALMLAALVGAVAMASHGAGSRGLETRLSTAARRDSAVGADV